MYERFTDRARKVMQLANTSALQRNSEFIDAGDVLLGILEEGGGNAVAALKDLGVEPKRLALAVQEILSSRPGIGSPGGRLPQNSSAKLLVQNAIQEAKNLNNNYVGTEHLLLAFFQDSYWKNFFAQKGLDYAKTSLQILRQLGQIPNDPPPGVQENATDRIMALIHRIDWEALEELCRICKVVRQLQPLGAVWQMAVQMSQDNISK